VIRLGRAMVPRIPGCRGFNLRGVNEGEAMGKQGQGLAASMPTIGARVARGFAAHSRSFGKGDGAAAAQTPRRSRHKRMTSLR